MSVTLYREGLPRVEIKSPVLPDREGMLVGLADMSYKEAHTVHAIVMGEDGSLHHLPMDQFRVQFHYDAETDDWVDESKHGPVSEDEE